MYLKCLLLALIRFRFRDAIFFVGAIKAQLKIKHSKNKYYK